MRHASLFEATFINRTLFRNRIMVAPMTRISASETGVPGEKMQDYYSRFARGGFGAIITEGSTLIRRGHRPMRFSRAS